MHTLQQQFNNVRDALVGLRVKTWELSKTVSTSEERAIAGRLYALVADADDVMQERAVLAAPERGWA